MTSNIGSAELLSHKRELLKEIVLTIVDPIIKAHFRPEFINGLDEILPFLTLQEKDMEKIVLIYYEYICGDAGAHIHQLLSNADAAHRSMISSALRSRISVKYGAEGVLSTPSTQLLQDI